MGNYWLNRAGLHVVRLLTAHTIMRLRMLSVSLKIPSEHRRYWQEHGYLQLNNFLADEHFTRLKKEVFNFKGATRQAHQGDTLTQRSVLPPDTVKHYPALDLLMSLATFKRYCSFTSGHVRPPLFYIETVINGGTPGGKDPQKHFHTDTFHPTLKCWFFVEPVKAEDGPFTYYPKSHRLTWKRLKWEYKKSLVAQSESNGLGANGSFRFTEDDIAELGLGNPISFTADENTLLLANTFGIHRRGDSDNQSRTSIWGDSRTNPFLPFPGITSRWINAFQYEMLERFRDKADAKAAKAGTTSPWRLLDENTKHHN